MHDSSSPSLPGYEAISKFEQSKSYSTAKREGIFYTPAEIARKMCADALTPYLAGDLDSLFEIKIIDPACGAGTFLIACREILFARLKELGVDDIFTKRRVIRECIFGVDRDPGAVKLCRELLAAGFSGINLAENIVHADSLFSLEDFDPQSGDDAVMLKHSKFISWQRVFPAAFSRGGFTLVIGNPPYGLSRDNKLTIAENEKLKRVYTQFKFGKVNKYLAAMAAGYALVKDHGTLSYLVPNSWLGIKSAKTLRKIFMEAGSFETISSFEQPVFPDLDVETIAFTYKKKVAVPEILIRNYVGPAEMRIRSETRLPKARCMDSADFIIPLKWHAKLSRLARVFEDTCFPLMSNDSPFKPLIALQAYSVGKGTPPQTSSIVRRHAFHASHKLTSNHFPYLTGKDIRRYRVLPAESYLHYGPHLAEPQQLSRFTGPRILVREILNPLPYKITAAIVDGIFLYNKSVLHIRHAADNPEDLYALLAILNSYLAGIIAYYFGRKSQRKIFPKLVNADLQGFPLPHTFHKVKKRLAAEAEKLTARAVQDRDISASSARIDHLVLEAYGLSPEDINF